MDKVTYTESMIEKGLLDLMKDKPFYKIKHQELIESAQISDKTFYRHFKDKYDVLSNVESDLIYGLASALENDRTALDNLGHIPTAKEISALATKAFRSTIDFCMKNKEALAILTSSNGDIDFFNKIYQTSENEFIKRFSYLFDDGIKSKSYINDMPASLIITIYVSNIVTIIRYLVTVDIDAFSPAAMREYIGKAQVISPVNLITEK